MQKLFQFSNDEQRMLFTIFLFTFFVSIVSANLKDLPAFLSYLENCSLGPYVSENDWKYSTVENYSSFSSFPEYLMNASLMAVIKCSFFRSFDTYRCSRIIDVVTVENEIANRLSLNLLILRELSKTCSLLLSDIKYSNSSIRQIQEHFNRLQLEFFRKNVTGKVSTKSFVKLVLDFLRNVFMKKRFLQNELNQFQCMLLNRIAIVQEELQLVTILSTVQMREKWRSKLQENIFYILECRT